MTIRIALRHETTYRFDRPVECAPHLVRLRPAPHCRTPIEAYSLNISGGEHFLNWQQDPFGNFIARLVFPKPITELTVAVEVVAPMTVINPFDFFIEECAETIPFAYPEALAKQLTPYLEIREEGPLLMAWLAEVPRTATATTAFLVALNQRLQADIAYTVRMEPGVQSCEETLTLRRGSCRDSSWLLVQILRHLGLAARFVSGYLVQLAADEKSLDGPSGTEVDFTDLHAWCEVFIPGAGWIGLDPTSGLFAGEGHLPLAATPDPGAAAPITGATDPCEVDFHFSMSVTRIHEDPRVTKPYDAAQWEALLACGEAVDGRLQAQGLALTMGGEPTFVAIDDVDEPEWNTEAQGPTKRAKSEELLRRLQPLLAPGSYLHYQQGKWYPGESLPRWALGCFWRRDGEAIWRDPLLLADMNRDYGVTLDQVRSFGQALSSRLGLTPDFLMEAFEDACYHLWIEQRQAPNVDLLASDLSDDEERARLARVLGQGLNNPSGLVLPLAHDGKRWRSSRWPLRSPRLTLIPGDSPIGLRLPLDSLPKEGRFEASQPQPWWSDQARLDDYHGRLEIGPGTSRTQQIQEQQAQADEPLIITSLCLQAREGKLCVFLPPLTELEHALELLAAVELCAGFLHLPVCIEGYPPPSDPRLQKFLITPDPGVIEVNILPASSWPEAVKHTELLYEQARLCRLRAEKFLVDGRHTGTGGGNHITLGAASPEHSPFLRRAELLPSMLTYWQHHPSLSFLFCGLFMGPTSQAPRFDEARHDSSFELEIAFAQLRELGDEGLQKKPWMMDRCLRHLLTDLVGNTHRAEFCIDKLFSPDSATGRLGILELRGFEMPPHARLSLAQQLLVRALTAHLAANPYRHPLRRWGTALHDRWMLPHHLWQDLSAVVDDLNSHGIAMDLDWFAPFLEFRFPVYGRVSYQGIEVELRQALEPWLVLGEEAAGGGTARYVDSSVERLQVRVTGLSDARYMVLCNGRPLPLSPTGRQDERIAGVRFKAWEPSSALHPAIPVHAPLVIDVVDTWNRRSVGGCTYHVAHPAGRNYESFPINANEAEARRLARFIPHGHRQGELKELPAEMPHPDFPCTLDLRRPPMIR
ncbi:MAG: transglutaminase family protein [Planctomycetota bacterium]|nr:MAG: transglutaminase family protein [Planctomycetota bacterium]